MRKIVYRDIQKTVNVELLHQQLATALGVVFIGAYPVNAKTRVALHSPSAADVDIATQIVQAHDANELTESQQVFQTIKDTILGTVGKSVTELTTAERWALLAGLLYQGRALAADMTIRHPKDWIARQDTDDE